MTLQDYTTDELRAELKRRATEARKAANVNRDGKWQYLYAEGTVVKVDSSACGRTLPFSDWRFQVAIDGDCVVKYGLQSWKKTPTCRVASGKFKKSTAPKEGNRVRLKCRVTKQSPRWDVFYSPVIDEIL